MEQHKHYQKAYSAFSNMSHSPERRAKSTCEMYDAHVSEVLERGGDLEKYERLFLAWIYSEGRCASAMIVGPARFPADRNRKRMETAMKRWGELSGYLDRLRMPPKEPRTELDYGINSIEYMVGDVLVKQNTEQNRLQLVFPAKPDAEQISKLKKNGFKWSPRNTAWQRQLTPNALRSLKTVL